MDVTAYLRTSTRRRWPQDVLPSFDFTVPAGCVSYLGPHTIYKHAIFTRYIEPAVAHLVARAKARNCRVVLFDLFAGPGYYRLGLKSGVGVQSSPLLLLDAAHRNGIADVHLYEANQAAYKHLVAAVADWRSQHLDSPTQNITVTNGDSTLLAGEHMAQALAAGCEVLAFGDMDGYTQFAPLLKFAGNKQFHCVLCMVTSRVQQDLVVKRLSDLNVRTPQRFSREFGLATAWRTKTSAVLEEVYSALRVLVGRRVEHVTMVSTDRKPVAVLYFPTHSDDVAEAAAAAINTFVDPAHPWAPFTRVVYSAPSLADWKEPAGSSSDASSDVPSDDARDADTATEAGGNPEEAFDAAVQKLKAVGTSAGAISKLLGYSGHNGARDLLNVRAGTSKKISLLDAIMKLRDALREQCTRQAPSDEPMSHQRATSVEALQAEFVVLFTALRNMGHSPGTISKFLGFSGSNGLRDLTSVLAGISRNIRLPDAIAKLQEMLRRNAEAPASPEPSCHSESMAQPAGFDKCDEDPMFSTSLHRTFEAHVNESTAESVPPAASTEAPGDLEAFDAAVHDLTALGRSMAAISKVLGFSGSNGARDLLNVRAGTSKKISLPAAIVKLRDALQEQCTRQAPSGDEPMSHQRATAAEALQVEFGALCKALKNMGHTPETISKLLGFSGSNGLRDLTSVLAGTSTNIRLPDAIAKLQEMLRRPSEAPASPEPSCHSESMESAQPAGFDKRDEDPMDSTRLRRTFEAHVNKLIAESVPPAAISVALGYSGANGRRDLITVLEGRSSRHTLRSGLSVVVALVWQHPLFRAIPPRGTTSRDDEKPSAVSGNASLQSDSDGHATVEAVTMGTSKHDDTEELALWRAEARLLQFRPPGIMVWLPCDHLTFVEDDAVFALKAALAAMIYDADPGLPQPGQQVPAFISRMIPFQPSELKSVTWRRQANFLSVANLTELNALGPAFKLVGAGVVAPVHAPWEQYLLIDTKQKFLDQPMDLRFLLRMVTTHPPIRDRLRKGDASFTLQNLAAVLEVLNDLYHGQSSRATLTPESQRNRAAQLSRAAEAIGQHVCGKDWKASTRKEMRTGAPVDLATHRAQRAALLRLYVAFDAVLREVILVYSPPPGTTITLKNFAAGTTSTAPFSTPPEISAALQSTDGCVDFMLICRTLGQASGDENLVLDHYGSDGIRHGIALEDSSNLVRAAQSCARFLSRYIQAAENRSEPSTADAERVASSVEQFNNFVQWVESCFGGDPSRQTRN
jgi:three-Cys-motif partner protein